MLSKIQTVIDSIDFGNVLKLFQLKRNSDLFIIFHSTNVYLENIILFVLRKKKINIFFENLYLNNIYQKTSLKADKLTNIYLKNHSLKNIDNEYFYMKIGNFYYEKIFRYCAIINFINSHKKISKDASLYLAKCKIVNNKIIINENRKIILYRQLNNLNDDEYRWTYNSKEKKTYKNLLRYLYQIIKNIFCNSPISPYKSIKADALILKHPEENKKSLCFQSNIINNKFKSVFINEKLQLTFNQKKYKINYLTPLSYFPFFRHLMNFKTFVNQKARLGIINGMILFNDWIISFFILKLLKDLNIKVFYSNHETPISNLFQQVCKNTNTVSLCYSFSAGYFPIQNCFSHQRKNADIFFVWSSYFSDLFNSSKDLSRFHLIVGSPIDNFRHVNNKQINKKIKKTIAFCDNTVANDLIVNKKNLKSIIFKLANFCVTQNYDMLIKVKKDAKIYHNLKKKFPHNVILDNNKGDLSSILQTNIIIAFSLSTLPIIASCLNKKIILIESEVSWIKKYAFLGEVNAKNETELIKMIKVILDQKNKSKISQIDEIHSFNDGKTGYRIYQYIEDIINSPYNEKKEKIMYANNKFSQRVGTKNIIFNNYN